MGQTYDAVVVGAGPAGISAAIRLAENGARTAVYDSNDRPGGQLIKQIHKFFGSAEVCAGVRGVELADRYYRKACELGVTFVFDAAVYDIEKAETGYVVYADKGHVTLRSEAKTVVLAVGAGENALAFPGWTLPGVMTAGAAQTLVNLERVRCGSRVLMVGAGNVGLIVSYQLRQAGIEVAAVIEAAPVIGGYQVHANKIKRLGIPVLTGYTIKEAFGRESVEGAVIVRVDEHFQPIEGTEERLEVDTICLAVGLSPLIRLGEIVGCDIRQAGDGAIAHDTLMQTTAEGVYVAGDAGGVEEASIAIEEGNIAGLRASVRLGFLPESAAAEAITGHQARIDSIRMKGERKTETVDFSRYRQESKAKAFIECSQEIPCNPCEKNCPVHAIKIGDPIIHRPVIDLEACVGCGRCVAMCPGQACFLVKYVSGKKRAELTFPYEFLPMPVPGSCADAVDKDGKVVCRARVERVQQLPAYSRTAVVTISFPEEYADRVRFIKG
ncbi:MAG: FAD-dependent oxidoreductase [Lachnospiraceae bacterium]|nr:FAD-dependent oxidoreductase [Lachnospiraceae bacterium]